MDNNARVAVIGLGALGLVTLKNLLEEGFDAIGFERNNYVGGLWKYREDDRTSVLESLQGPFTDFAFQRDVRSHPSAAEVQKYLEDYFHHFNLAPKARLNTSVRSITRDENSNKWVLHIGGQDPEYFDKVVVANGLNNVANIPSVDGISSFEGECLHARAFKSNFTGKRVLVVGIGNTGSDTATSLVGHAEKIYVAHRQGCFIVPRVVEGKALDHSLSYRLSLVQDILNQTFPNFAEAQLNKLVKGLQDKAYNIRPEWNLSSAPSLKRSIPTISDNIIARLESGDIKSVAGLQRVVGANEVELTDGTRLEVDCIIWCTGYKPQFGIIEPKYDPTAKTTPKWAASPGSNGKPLPRLYRNVFSLERPESLAFLGAIAFHGPAFQTYDLASMAIAQIWKGNSHLPSKAEMEKAVDEHHEWVCSIAKGGSVFPGIVKPGEWMRWANDAAGTGVNEYLGYGWKGWAYWLQDMRFCNLMVSGIYSPHIFRVFDGNGKRKKWDGAREAIERVNADVKAGVGISQKKSK